MQFTRGFFMSDFSEIKALWVEKYRPTSLDEYVFQNEAHREKFSQYIETKSIPNILLSGTQGTGKSTIARILINNIGVDVDWDVLVLNASDENSVDDVRSQIKQFITTFSASGQRIVLLEEADRLSPAAQCALKVLTEDYSDCARFIATCNHEHRLQPAFKSRFQHFKFKAPNADDVTHRIAQILVAEKVKAKLETIDKFVAIGFPDIRQTIQLIEQHVSPDGKLNEPTSTGGSQQDWKIMLLDHVASGDWQSSRQLLCGNVTSDEWEEVYTFLYTNLNRVSSWNNQQKDQAVVTIAQYLYQHSMVADPEINAAAMFIELSRI